jgi:hypothetical protein
MAKSKSKSSNDKSKSSSDKSKSKDSDAKSKDKKDKTEKVDTKKRNISIGILVALAVGLIIYAIYCFEAHKNNWFPFLSYKPNPPTESVIPTATDPDFNPTTQYTDTMGRLRAAGYTPNDGDDDRAALSAPNVEATLANNCYWFCQGVLQLDSSVLADKDNKPQVGTKLQDFSHTSGPKPVGDIESTRTGVQRQKMLKPADDVKSPWGCDCDGMDYSKPVRDQS